MPLHSRETTEDAAHRREVSGQSARDLLTVMFRRRNIFLGFFFSVVGSVALFSYLIAPTFEAEATILVREARADVPLAAKDSGELILLNEITEELLNSEIEILRSRALIEDVVRSLGPERSEAAADSTADSTEDSTEDASRDKMILRLEDDLEVGRIRKSNLIRASFRSKDPEEARHVVATLTDRYLELRTKIYLMPEAVDFFEGEMSEARQRLAQSEETLRDYLEEAGVTMVDINRSADALAAEKNQLLQRMSELAADLTATEVAIRAGEQRLSALGSRVDSEPERLPTAGRGNIDARFEQIQQGIVTLELQRDALLQEFTPDNRQVRDVETQIELAKVRLTEVSEEVGDVNRSEANPVRRALREDLLRAEAELEAARARLVSLRAQRASLARESSDLSAKSFDVDRLRRETRAAGEAYWLYSKKHEEARLSEAMDRRNLVDVSVAQPAKRPIEPIEPKIARNLVLGVILGAVGGLGLALGAGALDHTFTTGQDVERRLGIPLLASIPEG